MNMAPMLQINGQHKKIKTIPFTPFSKGFFFAHAAFRSMGRLFADVVSWRVFLATRLVLAECGRLGGKKFPDESFNTFIYFTLSRDKGLDWPVSLSQIKGLD